MNNSTVDTKSSVLYRALTELKNKGSLNTLQDAEAMITAFGADVLKKNTIKFDFELMGKTYSECLYEYSIPQVGKANTTFYVDKDLGFECGSRLPQRYKDLISSLHLSQAVKANTTPYVDKHSVFKCGNILPQQYTDLDSNLHLTQTQEKPVIH